MRRYTFLLGISLLIAPLSGRTLAQDFRARISGQVTDSSGAIIPDATVVVTSLERNTSSETVTNSVGRYLVQFLLPGHYTVTVEKKGFKKIVRTGISLESVDH